MKKSYIVVSCYVVLSCSIVSTLILINPFSNNLEASTFSQATDIKVLQTATNDLSSEINDLQSNLSNYKVSLDQLETQLEKLETEATETKGFLVNYYLDKLKDPTYNTIYNSDYIYYTAAEELGEIGKLAIPPLIERLSTEDDYERALALYALLLASQDESVKDIVGNDYIHTSLDFDARNHPKQVETALKWWEKYGPYLSETS